jgi:plastocyanin
MSRRITALVAAAAALGCTTVAIGTATAAQKAPSKKAMAIVGHAEFKVGRYAFDNQRFTPRRFDLRSGGEVTLRNKAKTEDPHTISLVEKSQLPDSFNCDACGQIFGAHGIDEQTGEMANPVVNVGGDGFDQPGDSIFIEPKARVSFDVTATAGTHLYFLCAVHPWMQGSINVK